MRLEPGPEIVDENMVPGEQGEVHVKYQGFPGVMLHSHIISILKIVHVQKAFEAIKGER